MTTLFVLKIIGILYLIVYVFSISSVRLFDKELRFVTEWVKTNKKDYFIVYMCFVVLFSPFILFGFITYTLGWKLINIILK